MSQVDSFMVGSSLPARGFYIFGRSVVVGITRLLCRPTVIGREKIPTQGAFVLAPVHRSYIDTPLAEMASIRMGFVCTRRISSYARYRRP